MQATRQHEKVCPVSYTHLDVYKRQAFDKLYKLTSNDVWFTCVSLLKDEENAKDIMQETYITAFLKLDTLDVYKRQVKRFCYVIVSPQVKPVNPVRYI